LVGLDAGLEHFALNLGSTSAEARRVPPPRED
jgi:hypothetical protein